MDVHADWLKQTSEQTKRNGEALGCFSARSFVQLRCLCSFCHCAGANVLDLFLRKSHGVFIHSLHSKIETDFRFYTAELDCRVELDDPSSSCPYFCVCGMHVVQEINYYYSGYLCSSVTG